MEEKRKDQRESCDVAKCEEKKKKNKRILPCGRMGKPVDHSDGAEGDNDSDDAEEEIG